MYRKSKDQSLCCYESANWIPWSCSNLFHMKGQPRFFLFGKAWCCNETDKCISCCMNLTEEKTLSFQMLYSHGFMVTFEDIWLNVFAKSFLFKKRREKNRYFCKQQLPPKPFSTAFLFIGGFPRRFSDVSQRLSSQYSVFTVSLSPPLTELRIC